MAEFWNELGYDGRARSLMTQDAEAEVAVFA